MKEPRKPFHGKLTQLIIRRWRTKLVLLFPAVVGVVIDCLTKGNGSFTIALTYVLLVFMIDLIYSMYEDAAKAHEEICSHSQKMIEALQAELGRLAERIDTQTNDLQVAKASAKYGGVVGSVLDNVYSIIRDGLEFVEHGFRVKKHELILLAYFKFWEALVEEQRLRVRLKLPPLTVFATHSCAIEIWKHPIMTHVLSKQKLFKKAGGEIRYILCGDGPTASGDYWEIANRMTGIGVFVKYYNKEECNEGPDHVKDFIVVKETKQAVMWEPFEAEKKIKSAIFTTSPYSSSNGEELIEMWNRLKETAIPLNGNNTGPYLES